MKISCLHIRQWFALVCLVGLLMFIKNYHKLKDFKFPYKLQRKTYTSISTIKTEISDSIDSKESVIVEKFEILEINTPSYNSESISRLNEPTVYNNKTLFSASSFTFSPFVNTYFYDSNLNSTTEPNTISTTNYVTNIETVENSHSELQTTPKPRTSVRTSSNGICRNFTKFCNASLATSHNKPIHVKLPQNFLKVSYLFIFCFHFTFYDFQFFL